MCITRCGFQQWPHLFALCHTLLKELFGSVGYFVTFPFCRHKRDNCLPWRIEESCTLLFLELGSTTPQKGGQSLIFSKFITLWKGGYISYHIPLVKHNESFSRHKRDNCLFLKNRGVLKSSFFHELRSTSPQKGRQSLTFSKWP